MYAIICLLYKSQSEFNRVHEMIAISIMTHLMFKTCFTIMVEKDWHKYVAIVNNCPHGLIMYATTLSVTNKLLFKLNPE